MAKIKLSSYSTRANIPSSENYKSKQRNGTVFKIQILWNKVARPKRKIKICLCSKQPDTAEEINLRRGAHGATHSAPEASRYKASDTSALSHLQVENNSDYSESRLYLLLIYYHLYRSVDYGADTYNRY